MLAAIKNEVITHLKTKLGANDYLWGIKEIRSGRVALLGNPIPSAYVKFPFITIYVDSSNCMLASGKSPYYIEAVFALEVYTVSTKNLGEAEDECLKLYLSDDGLKGIMKVFKEKQGFVVNGQPFLVTPSEQEARVIVGGTEDDGFTYAIHLPLRVVTWKD
jgi:hypothetical protein